MMKCLMILLFLNFFKFKNLKFNNLIIMMVMFLWMLNMNLNFIYVENIYLNYGYDFVSFMLILLVFWILNLCFMANLNFLSMNFSNYFKILINSLLQMLFLCFLSLDFMSFYIFFEFSIIPMLLLIMGWGLQVDRIQAGMYLLFYTLFGSLPLLMMLILLYENFNSLIYVYMNLNNMILKSFIVYMFMILAFLIKMPMYYLHLWLPKAHVEAPVSGSMILAGIMLKLGGYGLMRMMMFMKYLFLNYNYLIMNLSLIGGIYSSFMCLNMNDYKIIVAYSSVVHMSTLMSSLLSYLLWGYIGGFIMMIAHGLCSSSMFYLVNLNYERTYSRSTILNKGLLNIMPSISLLWFMICIINMSAPPSMNLISEIMIFISLNSWLNLFMFYLFLMTFFSSCYTIFIYSFSQHGKLSLNLFNFSMINCREYFIVIMHLFPLNLIFLNMNLMFYLNCF
uniref:NADH-ubiquinone oxidoreductase chain 4 n=1 Tax=Fornicia albalata TaxID=1911503 RepID=A0A6F8AA75_9HYME|nr:NADH dehydrogenase subunit 4 [Fornicia albalata]